MCPEILKANWMPVGGWIIHGIKSLRPSSGELCVANEFTCKVLFSEGKTIKLFGRAITHAQSCVFQGSQNIEAQSLGKPLKLMVTQPPLKKDIIWKGLQAGDDSVGYRAVAATTQNPSALIYQGLKNDPAEIQVRNYKENIM